MKTYRNLYPQITAFANLHAAFRKARKGKRDRPEVAAFEFDLEANLFQLQQELTDHTYMPGPYRNFYVRERKLRLIADQRTLHRVRKNSSRMTRISQIKTKSVFICGIREPNIREPMRSLT